MIMFHTLWSLSLQQAKLLLPESSMIIFNFIYNHSFVRYSLISQFYASSNCMSEFAIFRFFTSLIDASKWRFIDTLVALLDLWYLECRDELCNKRDFSKYSPLTRCWMSFRLENDIDVIRSRPKGDMHLVPINPLTSDEFHYTNASWLRILRINLFMHNGPHRMSHLLCPSVRLGTPVSLAQWFEALWIIEW